MQAMLKGEQKTKLSKIGQLVAAYNVGGTSTTDSRLCQWLFPCRGDHNKIEASSEIEGRIVPCKVTGAMCPGYSITCALCGMFMPSACGVICPYAGLYCGVSGYACDPPAPATTTTTTTTEDIPPEMLNPNVRNLKADSSKKFYLLSIPNEMPYLFKNAYQSKMFWKSSVCHFSIVFTYTFRC